MLSQRFTFICDHCPDDPEWQESAMSAREAGDGSVILSCPQCGSDKAVIAPEPHAYQPGVILLEKHPQAHPRVIVDAAEGQYVLVKRSGRTTRISWKNLGRYRIVGRVNTDA